VEFFVDIVRRDGEHIEAVELKHIARTHEVVGVIKLLLHRRRCDQNRVRPPNPRDVILGKIVVMRVRQQHHICLGVLVHPEWVDMDFDPHPSNAHG